MRLFLIALFCIVSAPAAADLHAANLSERMGCPVIRMTYRHYAKQGFTKQQMADYLRSQGLSEARIEGLSKCIK